MNRHLLTLAALGLLLAGVAAAARPARPLAADTYNVDKTYSMLLYKVRHLGVSWFWARVTEPTGSFRIDEADAAASFIHVTAEIARMDTAHEGRDRFLASPDFFNAREYPTAEFHSTSVRRSAPGIYEAAGTLTMHGVTRPVTARVADFTAVKTDRFGFRAGFEASITVRRSDFGMDLFVKDGTLGDEVTIIASIQGLRQDQSG
jgi:polyisoprenoid-binding protein YceI